MTINQNLDRISQAKSDIKAAIIAKGGTIGEDVTIDKYAAAIEALPSGGGSNERKNELILSSDIDNNMVHYCNRPYTNVINGISSYNSGDWEENIGSKRLNIGDKLTFRFDAMMMYTATPYISGYLKSDHSYTLNVAGTIYVTNDYEYYYYCRSCGLIDISNLNIIIKKEYGRTYSACRSMFENNFYLTDTPNITVTGNLDESCCASMFSECAALKNIHLTIEDSSCTLMKSSMSNMFQKTGVEEFVMPQFGTAYDSAFMSLFYGDTALRYVEFPNATYTGANVFNNTFNGCTSLQTFVIKATTPPPITSSTFTGCPVDMIIYVPDESVDAYKAKSYWNARADYIKPISEKPTE